LNASKAIENIFFKIFVILLHKCVGRRKKIQERKKMQPYSLEYTGVHKKGIRVAIICL
jgi:hypothetical protein